MIASRRAPAHICTFARPVSRSSGDRVYSVFVNQKLSRASRVEIELLELLMHQEERLEPKRRDTKLATFMDKRSSHRNLKEALDIKDNYSSGISTNRR